jgi:hypothetical protein
MSQFFGNIQFNENRPAIQRMPVETFAGVSDQLQKQYYENYQRANELSMLADSIEVEDRNIGIKNRAVDRIDGTIRDISENGDFEYAAKDIFNLANDFRTDKALKASAESYQKRMAWNAEAKKMIDENKLSNERYAKHLNLHSQAYTDEIVVDENGIAHGVFSASKPVENPHINDQIAEFVKDWEMDKVPFLRGADGKNYGDKSNAGKGYIGFYETEYIDEQEVYDAARTYVLSKEENQAYLNELLMFEHLDKGASANYLDELYKLEVAQAINSGQTIDDGETFKDKLKSNLIDGISRQGYNISDLSPAQQNDLFRSYYDQYRKLQMVDEYVKPHAQKTARIRVDRDLKTDWMLKLSMQEAKEKRVAEHAHNLANARKQAITKLLNWNLKGSAPKDAKEFKEVRAENLANIKSYKNTILTSLLENNFISDKDLKTGFGFKGLKLGRSHLGKGIYYEQDSKGNYHVYGKNGQEIVHRDENGKVVSTAGSVLESTLAAYDLANAREGEFRKIVSKSKNSDISAEELYGTTLAAGANKINNTLDNTWAGKALNLFMGNEQVDALINTVAIGGVFAGEAYAKSTGGEGAVTRGINKIKNMSQEEINSTYDELVTSDPSLIYNNSYLDEQIQKNYQEGTVQLGFTTFTNEDYEDLAQSMLMQAAISGNANIFTIDGKGGATNLAEDSDSLKGLVKLLGDAKSVQTSWSVNPGQNLTSYDIITSEGESMTVVMENYPGMEGIIFDEIAQSQGGLKSEMILSIDQQLAPLYENGGDVDNRTTVNFGSFGELEVGLNINGNGRGASTLYNLYAPTGDLIRQVSNISEIADLVILSQSE